ncbi:hypothetical protein GCM10011316_12550 [Roseibium aquae]|uniref:DUF3305 domain-containing protein n=1 Tax=Roseibium aquae TaxID=1323746 RepID=A0A916TFW6_9HYPH|nr:DUF3305 domain-containing protein [Roseibium aquae]GGB42107.1 hypothetical protein GCM10011316_12550 [Roseibium aquae]
MKSEILMPVGILIERRKSTHPWADYTWKGLGVVPNALPTGGWQIAVQGDMATQFLYASVNLVLHRRMGEAYDANVETGSPALWIMLDDADTQPVPYRVHGVTADPYEAQGRLDSAEGLVERVDMPPEILAWAVDYIKQMPDPGAFLKRKRVPEKLEEQKFGKMPIFSPEGRRVEGEDT